MKNKLYVLMVVMAGMLWGCSCLFVNYLNLNTALSSMQITSIRITLAAVVLNVMLVIKGKGFSLYRLSLRSYLLVAISGLVSVYAMCQFYYSCILETSAAVGVVLLYTAPVFVMLLSLIFFKEPITTKKIVAFLFAIVGCALVSGLASGSRISLLGILFGILGGFSYSLYGIFTAFFMKENKEPFTFTALNFAFAAIASLALSKPWQIVTITQETENPLQTVLVYILLAIITAVLPFLLYTNGLVGVKPDTASILAFSEPMTACLLGVFVLGQKIDVFGVVGILCVCMAIVILNVVPKRKKEGARHP